MDINSIKPVDYTRKLTTEEQQKLIRFTQKCFSLLNIQTDIPLTLEFDYTPKFGIQPKGSFAPPEITHNKHFRIYVITNRSLPVIYLTIAHELIHLKQWIIDRLRFINDKSNELIIFKGKTYPLCRPISGDHESYLKYKAQPWEAEAFREMYPLARKAYKLLK